jgi:cell division protease FtsH
LKDGKTYEVTGPREDQKLLDDLEKQNLSLSFTPPATAPWWVSRTSDCTDVPFYFRSVLLYDAADSGGGSKVSNLAKAGPA